MLSYIWNTLLYRPLLNALAFLIYIVPGGDVGVAIILLTLLVKVALFPLSQKSIESQTHMNALTPELNKIKSSGATKEEQARLTFDLYKKNKINPFSGCLLILIQLPIIFALYYVFLKGVNLDQGLLYSFFKNPPEMNMLFLGLLDISQKSLLLAILAGISQYFQAHFMKVPQTNNTQSSKGSFQENFAKSMQIQMKYVFPFVVALISANLAGAVALYWITSNMFAIGQQIYVNKKHQGTVIAVK